ncbi:hypothetical protein [Aminobacter sp. SR38]|uniref:hypothetical protein n=1 Tax=Aminobacter sp. SR38 TaxID=2774562 RepID=UPI001FEED409|nr:hypothetical protein [Aminobacter sp. SR38]
MRLPSTYSSTAAVIGDGLIDVVVVYKIDRSVAIADGFLEAGGREQVIVPNGVSSWVPARARIDNTMVKAIARGFRWRKFLESGVYGTVEEIAVAEKINPSYVSRVLRLTLLAPDLVEAILDGRQSANITLAALMKPFPVEWEKQLRAHDVKVMNSDRAA